MTNPSDPIRDKQGHEYHDGTFEYAQVFGEAVADVVTKAIHSSQPVRLVPFAVSAKPIAIPIENKIYRAARELGVLQRAGLVWTGDSEQIIPFTPGPTAGATLAMEIGSRVFAIRRSACRRHSW